MLAEELFYRAGGLVRVRPILFEGLMLHVSAPLSTALERMPGLAAALLDDHPMDAGDVLVIASNSGSNAVTVDLARLARDAGVHTIAITSLGHATSSLARASEGTPDCTRSRTLVIDNGGVVGDAAVDIAGLAGRVAPTSTVVGAAIVEALVAEVVERLVARGIVPEVYASSNVAGGRSPPTPGSGDPGTARLMARRLPVRRSGASSRASTAGPGRTSSASTSSISSGNGA